MMVREGFKGGARCTKHGAARALPGLPSGFVARVLWQWGASPRVEAVRPYVYMCVCIVQAHVRISGIRVARSVGIALQYWRMGFGQVHMRAS